MNEQHFNQLIGFAIGFTKNSNNAYFKMTPRNPLQIVNFAEVDPSLITRHCDLHEGLMLYTEDFDEVQGKDTTKIMIAPAGWARDMLTGWAKHWKNTYWFSTKGLEADDVQVLLSHQDQHRKLFLIGDDWLVLGSPNVYGKLTTIPWCTPSDPDDLFDDAIAGLV